MKEAVSATTIIPNKVEEPTTLVTLVKDETEDVCNTLAMSLKMEKERNSQLEATIKTLTAKLESYEAMFLSIINAEVSARKFKYKDKITNCHRSKNDEKLTRISQVRSTEGIEIVRGFL